MATEARLWQAYSNDFPIGAAVNPAVIKSHWELITQHFNSITAENEMKPCNLQPLEGQFDFTTADRMVAFAKQNNMKMRGHTLVWHAQTPDWFFTDGQGGAASRDTLLGRMKEHISTVAGHFKGSTYCWDVVNEAIDDHGGGQFLRKSPWLEIIGPDFLQKAFAFAHEADPGAQLFYNDYNETDPVKCAKICRLVRQLKEQGVPIHGLGLQGHWNIFSPTLDEIRTALDQYAALGVKLQITELDVSIYASSDKSTEPATPLEALLEKQAQFYESIFRLFREYREHISGVTFWGVADDATWLKFFPVMGRKNYPLLFDEDHQAKEAFQRIMKLG